ncbi:hypothetical protein Nepgr_007824 [Nepenthes gracilis]|uniref:Uncharacterized protein n=1 Tax=Nepenthes gracilis TaxID=150966 RepID=A0AAD3XIP5_NEPGR|nr:hypothetical protein Nepgr_007824 [Nepenthes gracilis]
MVEKKNLNERVENPQRWPQGLTKREVMDEVDGTTRRQNQGKIMSKGAEGLERLDGKDKRSALAAMVDATTASRDRSYSRRKPG